MKFDTDEINKIDISKYLEARGYKKDNSRSSGLYTYFYSPFRTETGGSFCVYNNTNSWYDFGNDKGGNIISLVMLLDNVNFYTACQKLTNNVFIPHVNKIKKIDKTSPWIIDSISDLDEELLNYSRSRGISDEIVNLYCSKLIIYHKDYPETKRKVIGFENDSGGFEFRSPDFKKARSPKDITTIVGKEDNHLLLFEGFFDFMSYLMYKGIKRPKNTCKVLNSLSLMKRIKTHLPIHIYLDHGEAVEKQLMRFDFSFIDKRELFKEHEDFNDFWKSILNE